MIELINHQTGNININLSVLAESSFGSGLIEFGCGGFFSPTFSIYLTSGEIVNESGYYLGSYIPEENCDLSLNIYKDTLSFEYNNNLVLTNYKIRNQDINFINLEKYNNTDLISVFYKINGLKNSQDKSCLFISKSGIQESGITSLISGTNFFQGNEGFNTGYYDYTGYINQSTIDNLNTYDLITFGQYVEKEGFNDITGWSKITSPIIFIDASIAGYDGVGVISGQEYTIPNQSYQTGYQGWGVDKSGYANKVLTRTDGDIVKLYTPSNFNLYKYTLYNDSESILFNNNVDETNMVDILYNTRGYSQGVIQKGRRVIFNTPITGSPVSELITDNFKNILISVVYDEIVDKTTIGD